MEIKNILAATAMAALAVSCGKNDDPAPNPPVNGSPFNGVIFSTGITNPEGNDGTIYLQAVKDMHEGTYSNENSMPTSFGTNPLITSDRYLYTFPAYMNNTALEITRYKITGNGEFQKEAAMPVPAGSSACNIVILNKEKAYLSMQGIGKVRVFNPTTMKQTKDIDLNSLAQAGMSASPASMLIRDGKLYVGLNQMGPQWMPTQNSVELALIDTQTDEVEKHIVNKTLGMCFATRPVDPNSIFMDENKDIYINCLGSFGFIPGLNGGIVRIKNGSTDIDPDYSIRLDQTDVEGLSVGKCDFLASVYYHKDKKLYANLCAHKLDPQAAQKPYTSMTSLPCVIDLEKKTIKTIKGMEVSNPQGIAVGKYKDLIVFGSANAKADGFYTYNPSTGEVKGPVMKVQGNPTLFYSFQ